MTIDVLQPSATALPANMSAADLLERINQLEQRVAQLEAAPAQDIENKLAMVVFSGDMDRAIAAFIIATGAASMGLEVSMFFTFWGLSVVKKERQLPAKTSWSRALQRCSPLARISYHSRR